MRVEGRRRNPKSGDACPLLNDGSALVSSASVEIGQGIQTVLQQIIAQELGLPPDKIRVGEIDTRYTPFDQATNASSATVLMDRRC